jgi:four helix bundle protein
MAYKKLIVWQRAIDLVVLVYELTKKFPKSEQFGLVSQMRRAAVSIASNIAEGQKRSSDKDFVHFLHFACGSAAELETQMVICKKLHEFSKIDYTEVDKTLEEVIKLLDGLIRSFKK